MMAPTMRWALATLGLLASVTAASAETVTFKINATANVRPISRWIYGINEYALGGKRFPNLTFRRVGGNRWTAYNWENNASNAGSDYIFQNDDYLGGGDTPGGAVIPAITNAKSQKAGLLLTIPIQDYVAADKKGDGDVHDSGPDYLKTRFRRSKPEKGAAFTLTPKLSDASVYQDEFVNWLKTKYPHGQSDPLRPIWFSMDNEPDLWAETHAEVHPAKPTYAEMAERTAAYAKAVKAVTPKALIFGPANYGWYGFVRFQDAPDANNRDFQNFYLSQMRAASKTAGKRLLDVLDVHWYPEARAGDYKNGVRITENDNSPDVVAARLQAPRSLWDSTYVESSWITHDWYSNQPVKLLPRLKDKIADHYPGTKLAITEYNYGGGAHISGGIAQADVLGIFGRDGLFAAAHFPLIEPGPETYVEGAFKMYRDFNGAKGAFGDKSIKATTTSNAQTSVYASLDSTNSKRMVIVALNKTGAPIKAAIALSHAKTMKTARVYRLTDASPAPKAHGSIKITNGHSFSYTMPAFSVTTLELSAK